MANCSRNCHGAIMVSDSLRGVGVKSEVRSWKWEVVSGAMGLMGVLRLREDVEASRGWNARTEALVSML